MLGRMAAARDRLTAIDGVVEAMPPTRRRLVLFAVSLGGLLFTLLLLWVGYKSGQFNGRNDWTRDFDPAGDLIRAGGNPYTTLGEAYSPPFLLASAAISWLPVPVAGTLLCCVEILSLRYIAGSWIGVGILAWCPLLAFELVLGNANLVLGACIVAAVRGHGWAGVAGGLIKMSGCWRSATGAALDGRCCSSSS